MLKMHTSDGSRGEKVLIKYNFFRAYIITGKTMKH